MITQSGRDFYNKNKEHYTHILSIVCPDEKELLKPIHEHHLIVKMWDIDKPLENKFRKYDPPNKDDVLHTIEVVGHWWLDASLINKPFNLLIHCDAGVSRSSAMALGVLWEMSYYIFNKNPLDAVWRTYLEARKEWCAQQVDPDNSVQLKRYIEGRFNPGVQPNKAIMDILRLNSLYFPW